MKMKGYGMENKWLSGQIPQPSGKVSSSNPLLKPHMSRTWGVGLDIDRCIR